MTATGRTGESIAAAVESAGFVRIDARADGDGLAAAGVLARTLAERQVPFQVSLSNGVGARSDRVDATTDADTSIVIGESTTDGESVFRLDDPNRPASLEAADLVTDLGASPDPVLALAGAFAAGVELDGGTAGSLLESADDRGLVARRPGVAAPTADPVDGLAHSTLVYAPWSGDRTRVRDALGAEFLAQLRNEVASGGVDVAEDADVADSGDALDERAADAHRRLASLVAVDATGASTAVDRAAESISRVLRPYATPAAPFQTIGGYADVLEAVARERPGVGVPLAIGHDARADALDAWRDHGRRLHEALTESETSRHDGVYVLVGARIDASSAPSVARLTLAYRSPEPVVLALGDDVASIATADEPVGPLVDAVATRLVDEVGDAPSSAIEYDYGRRVGTISVGELAPDDVIDAARGVL